LKLKLKQKNKEDREMKQKFLSLVIAAAMAVSTLVPAYAETTISASGGTGNMQLVATIQAATFSVVVPTSLAITVAADGTVTTADNAAITNNSYGAVKVSNMTITASNGWSTVDYDSTNVGAEKVDSKKFALVINDCKTTGADAITFDASKFPSISGKTGDIASSLALTYDAKVVPQTTSQTNMEAAKVIFTVTWDLADDEEEESEPAQEPATADE
jgi:hypothetical protein